MQQTCKQCSANFEVTNEDLAFLEKVSPIFNGKKELIPPPTHCPRCRQQRRFTWRNERTLHRRICNASGQQIFSIYEPTVSFPVYKQKVWWSDSWDGLSYGKTFDPSRPFFDQFMELRDVVPHMSLCNDSTNVNCEYVNQTGNLKDCYLTFDSDSSERVYYCHRSKFSNYSVDCTCFTQCELCYECIDCRLCYGLQHARNCENCSNSMFLRDCKSCSDCLCCVSLRGKKFCIFNEQLTEEEYRQRLAAYGLGSNAARRALSDQFESWQVQFPVKLNQNEHTENCSGNYIRNAKNTKGSFDCEDCQDCTWCTNLSNHTKDCVDYDVWGFQAELCYECMTVGDRAFQNIFCVDSWGGVSDLLYCDHCMQSSHLFGCVGLKNKKYCVLNTQYSPEEYERLVATIINHMRTTGEWGEFFPLKSSAFPYNATTAQLYHPLTEEDALKMGMRWRQSDDVSDPAAGSDMAVPDHIADATDALTSGIIRCAVTGKPFRIIKQELDFYRSQGIPLPLLHPNERHRRRMSLRMPRMLWDRQCDHCQKPISTSYAPDRPEIVYCEECYLATVY